MLNARPFRNACVALVVWLLASTAAAADPVRVGVSEQVYGDLAQQIGGRAIAVSLFQRPVSPLPALDIVICGCSRSDGWLAEAAQRGAEVLAVRATNQPVAGHRAGMEFPWYDVPAMARLAQTLAAELTRRAPAEARYIASNTAHAMAGFSALDRRIEDVAKTYANSDVLLADELFRDMTGRLRFKIRDEDYLNNLKPGAPPSARSLAGLKQAIQRRAGSIFLYDKDAAGAAIKELATLATENGIPVVALHERSPKGLHYQQWMLRQINAVHGALNEAAP
jgi:zinc/manganese transport system substrate-binding protein